MDSKNSYMCIPKNDCGDMVLSPKKLLEHMVVSCPNSAFCEEVIAKCDMELHLALRCKGTYVTCLQSCYGCNFFGPRCALSHHLRHCTYQNVQKDSLISNQIPILEGYATLIDINRGCYDLGMTIVGGCDTPLVCVIIQDIIPDGIIARDGRLSPGDQLLEVNGYSMTQATHSEAKKALCQSHPVFHLMVYREKTENLQNSPKEGLFDTSSKMLLNDHNKMSISLNGPRLHILNIINDEEDSDNEKNKENEHRNNTCAVISSKCLQIPRHTIRSSIINSVTKCPRRKTITIQKQPNENLGLSVAGGVSNSRGDLPIYISNIQKNGNLQQCNLLKKGDILLKVNGTDMLGKTHHEAVTILKNHLECSYITMDIIEGPETSATTQNFCPSWRYWLSLPKECQFVKSVQVEKAPDSALGFSIVGGSDCSLGPLPIYVKSVIPGSPAANEGKIKSGDMLLSVNKCNLENTTHCKAVSILRCAHGCVQLKIVSWPGTLI